MARKRIQSVDHWFEAAAVKRVIEATPSLRGMVFGNLAELKFEEEVLQRIPGVAEISKDDDHAKSKSDRTFAFRGRIYSIQSKSIQTNSLRDLPDGVVGAAIQNDASDRRTITLPTGEKIETTCYLVGEYDILATSLFPFTGRWKDFAFKRNRDLTRSRFKNYADSQKIYLLSTLEPITWPLDKSWSMDLASMLDKTLGRSSSS